MEKSNYYACCWKPFICKEMLNNLLQLPFNVFFLFIDDRSSAAAKMGSQRPLMNHLQM